MGNTEHNLNEEDKTIKELVDFFEKRLGRELEIKEYNFLVWLAEQSKNK